MPEEKSVPSVLGYRMPAEWELHAATWLSWPRREGISFPDIIRDYYPDIDLDDIRACVQYAIDVVAVEDIHVATAP